MSMYQMINGVNPATFFILPMLGKHPDEYPRFRDCWIKGREWVVREDGMPVIADIEKPMSEEPRIYVYTRAGGNNRESYEKEIEAIQGDPFYVTDYDDEFDCTYATFVFRVPVRWLADFKKITDGNITDVSKDYQKQLYKVYPKLSDHFDGLFKKEEHANS